MAISMMEAYMIEVLKTHSYTYDEVKSRIEQNQLKYFNKEHDEDFSVLIPLNHESPHTFKEAYAGNYQVKFMTMNGLKNLIRMRFNITGEHYELLEQGNGLRNLQIDAQTEQQISAMLSSNWKVERNGEFVTLYV